MMASFMTLASQAAETEFPDSKRFPRACVLQEQLACLGFQRALNDKSSAGNALLEQVARGQLGFEDLVHDRYVYFVCC